MNAKQSRFSAMQVMALYSRGVSRSTYQGIPCRKSPTDMWIYQELIWSVRPSVLIEIGAYCGGSTLALAHIMDKVGGIVYCVEKDASRIDDRIFEQKNILVLPGTAQQMRESIGSNIIADLDRVMIIEDSSHEYKNTLDILNAYHDLVTFGSYFIVEDTVCHHGLDRGPKPGPMDAVNDFMMGNRDFTIEKTMERFFITFNPNGYLKKIRT